MAELQGQSAETRILPLMRRADLESRSVHFGGTRFVHIKDPISLRYFQLKPEEHAVLQMLDGTVSLREIRRRFEEQFAPLRLSMPQLQSFLSMMHGLNLVVSDSAGQAEVMAERQRSARQQRLISTASSLLAMRFRGFDPHAFLNALQPIGNVLFRPVGVTLALCWILLALVFATSQADVLQLRLPKFQEFFSASNWIWLAATLGSTKILHELGHALSCRYFKAECHEMGFMLLVGTPCLYCNVSDAWMLPSRWRRIAISAAGMYVEAILAATCFLLWWYSLPGFFNSLCLNVVVICTISTVFFNGNPLLRYDGYYILADLLDIPNLRQQANALIGNALGRWFFGVDVANQRLLPERHQLLLLVWGLGAGVYRVLMLWGILWFVGDILRPYGLQPIAFVLATITIVGTVLGPVWFVGQLMSNPFWSRTVNWPRFWFRAIVAAVLIGVGITVPWPRHISAPVVVQPENMKRVFVAHAGRLLWAVDAGQSVEAGEVIGRLENLKLEQELVRLAGEVALLEKQLKNLEARRSRDREQVDALIPTMQERLSKKRDEHRQRQTDAEKLIIRAPIAGRVLTAPEVKPHEELDGKDGSRLPNWKGSVLDAANFGSTLETGTEFCWLAPTSRFEATLAIDQNDIEFIGTGQRVALLLEHGSLRSVQGLVADIAESDVNVAPRELLEHDHFPTKIGSDGTPHPVSTAYFARVTLDEPTTPIDLFTRGTGMAAIDVEPQSILIRFTRFVRQTFRFRS